MSRAHVEFVQSQNVAWRPASENALRRDAALKMFSLDAETGAFTALLRYAGGAVAHEPLHRAGSEELYVLEGELAINGVELRRHHYAYLPAGYVRRGFIASPGTLVLTFFNGGFADLDAARTPAELREAPVLPLDAQAMEWDGATLDPKLAHLRLSRKILRAAPDDSCRTYLLAGLPHGRPRSGYVQLERHPHDEEMFLIEGDMSCPQGVMRPGAYFYRPRGIVHGPHFSDHGFFMFMRNPGTSTIRTEWFGDEVTLPAMPTYEPVLPADAPAEWRRAVPSRPVY